MTKFRVESRHGRYILCGGIIPYQRVHEGQTWSSADGSNHTVQIISADREWVDYSWIENGEKKFHCKNAFAFQCRYCLVLDTPNIPLDIY